MIKKRDGTFAYDNKKGLVEGFNAPHELTQQLRANPSLSLIHDNSKIKYTVQKSDGRSGDRKTVSGAEAEYDIRSGKYFLVGSEWDDDESALKTGAKSFTRELTFGLVKPRKKEGYSKKALEILEKERKKDAKLAHYTGAAAGFVGGGFGAVPKAVIKGASKLGLTNVAKAAGAFDITKIGAKAGQFGQKLDNLLGTVGKAKLAGKAAELTAYSAPYAIASGMDNKDVKSVSKFLGYSLATGATIEGVIAGTSPIGRAISKSITPIKQLAAKTYKVPEAVSTSLREKFFNINTPLARQNFVKSFRDEKVKDIIKAMPPKSREALSKNLGKDINIENYVQMAPEDKFKVITSGLRGFDELLTKDIWKGYDAANEKLVKLGDTLSELRKTAGKEAPSKVLLNKELQPLNSNFGMDKVLKELQSVEISTRKKLKSQTPEGKQILNTIKGIKTELTNAKKFTLQGNVAYQKALKKAIADEKDLSKIIKEHRSKKTNLETSQSKAIKESDSLAAWSKAVGKTNYMKQIDDQEKILKTLSPKYEKLLTDLKNLSEANISLGYTQLRNLREGLDNNISKVSSLKNIPVINKIRNQLKDREKTILITDRKLKSHIQKVELDYNYNKNIMETLGGGKKNVSEIQGMSLTDRFGKIVGYGTIGLLGVGTLYNPLFAIPLAATSIGMYTLTNFLSSRGKGTMQAADFFERLAAKMNSAKNKTQRMNNPEELKSFMRGSKSPFSIPLEGSKAKTNLGINAIRKSLDVGTEEDMDKKTPDDQALMGLQKDLVDGVYEQGVGTANLAIDFIQNINQEYSPALDAEKLLFKEKTVDLINQFMPEEIKVAVANGEPKAPPITKWKIDNFKENVEVGLNPLAIYDHVKNNTLTYQHLQAVQMVDPEAYQQIALNLLQNKDVLDYNQKKELKKILNEQGGFHVLAKGEMAQPQKNNKNKVSRKVDTADFLPVQQSARVG